ncbi:MAG: MBL fold metallo-hydrolase, partial [Bilophila sp.]
MKVHFLGAAQTVTGSCYLIEACGARFTVDCGMHQGNSAIEARNFDTENYHPENIDFIILTHSHIDHSGLLPRIVHEGFKGPIYCTPPTADLVALMLEDSGHIQEMEAEWRRKKQSRHSGQNGQNKDIAPLYTVDDARLVPGQCHLVEYNTRLEPHPGIVVTYRDAGHILGSAFLEIVVTEEGKATRIVFSGDLGRPGTLLMHEPAVAEQADYLFMESTYGDRNHKNEEATFDELAEAIAYSYNKHDRVIIPAFAVGRTQEILYCLYLLRKQGRLPEDIPIFVDSPLAIRATEVFKKHAQYLDAPEVQTAANLPKLLPNLK